MFSLSCLKVGAYLYVIPPELQQRGETSFDLAKELVEEGQLSDAIFIEQGAQTWQDKNQKHLRHSPYIYSELHFHNSYL